MKKLLNRLMRWLAAQEFIRMEHRLILLRWLGLHLNDGVYIESGACSGLHNLDNIWLGQRVYINRGCFLEARSPIILERDVCLGPQVTIITTTHTIGGPNRRVGNTCVSRPVRVGAGSWICSNAQILPGVSIGPGCVIAAGAQVNHDCIANGLYAGVPAKLIGLYVGEPAKLIRMLNHETDDRQTVAEIHYLDESLSPPDRQGCDMATRITQSSSPA